MNHFIFLFQVFLNQAEIDFKKKNYLFFLEKENNFSFIFSFKKIIFYIKRFCFFLFSKEERFKLILKEGNFFFYEEMKTYDVRSFKNIFLKEKQDIEKYFNPTYFNKVINEKNLVFFKKEVEKLPFSNIDFSEFFFLNDRFKDKKYNTYNREIEDFQLINILLLNFCLSVWVKSKNNHNEKAIFNLLENLLLNEETTFCYLFFRYAEKDLNFPNVQNSAYKLYLEEMEKMFLLFKDLQFWNEYVFKNVLVYLLVSPRENREIIDLIEKEFEDKNPKKWFGFDLDVNFFYEGSIAKSEKMSVMNFIIKNCSLINPKKDFFFSVIESNIIKKEIEKSLFNFEKKYNFDCFKVNFSSLMYGNQNLFTFFYLDIIDSLNFIIENFDFYKKEKDNNEINYFLADLLIKTNNEKIAKKIIDVFEINKEWLFSKKMFNMHKIKNGEVFSYKGLFYHALYQKNISQKMWFFWIEQGIDPTVEDIEGEVCFLDFVYDFWLMRKENSALKIEFVDGNKFNKKAERF